MKYYIVLMISLFLIYSLSGNAQIPMSVIQDSVVDSNEVFVIPITSIRDVYPETATIELKPCYSKMVSRNVGHCKYVMVEHSSLLVRRFPYYSSVRTKEPVIYIGGKRIKGAKMPKIRMLSIVIKHLDENERASIIDELTAIRYRIKGQKRGE